MRPRFHLWILVLLTCATGLAKDRTEPAWRRQIWSTEDGLPQSSVHQILQLRNGFLWVATEGGVARFDGEDFARFGQEDVSAFTTDDTCCLAEDGTGGLWIGTSDGLIRYAQGRFQRFSAGAGLPSASVLAVSAASDGSVLALTTAGLARVSADGRAHALGGTLPSDATAFTQSPAGVLWLASRGGIFRQNGTGGFTRIAAPVSQLPVRSMIVSRNGDLWWSTSSSVSVFDKGAVRTWTVGAWLPGTRVNALMVDRSGTAWVGTNHGLVTLVPGKEVAVPMPLVGTTPVLSLLEDREGNVWVGTENSGLEVLRPETLSQLGGLDGRIVTAVVQTSDGTKWIGTRDDGLWRFREGRLEKPAAEKQLASQVILSLAPGSHKDLWVGTPDGLDHLDGSSVRSYTSVDGLPDDFIRSLLVDSDGSLWIGTRRGLAHWQGGQIATLTRSDGLASDLTGVLLRGRSGALWIATLGGISRLEQNKLATFTMANGMPGDITTSFAQDELGELWIGTRDGGLAVFTPRGIVSLRQSGLPHSIDSLVIDAHGFLWMGTSKGLVRAPLAELRACTRRQACKLNCDRFGVPDGMPSEEASTIGHPAAWRMKDGKLWFATRKGVAIVNPAHLQLNQVPPPVVIEGFDLDGVPEPVQSADLAIKPGHASFTFHYAGLSYSAPAQVRYRYMLEGFDRGWTSAGDRRTAYYTNLPARHYAFRVQAANNDGVWNRQGAELRFRVLPPFYRRWWFYWLALLSAGAGVYLWHSMRVRRLRMQFRAVLGERTRIAREIHDTLAQDFVGVSLQLEVAAQHLAAGDLGAASEQIHQTRALVQQGLKEARQSIWELRASAGEDTLPARLSRLAERAPAGVAVTVNVAGAYRLLQARTEAEMLRITQEALNNVLRHAEATVVLIQIHYGTASVSLRVVDDGRGFDPAAVAADRYGVQGMRERAAAIGASFELESSPGAGTRIRLVAQAE